MSSQLSMLNSQFGFSARYDAALALAARAHRDQLRKGTDLPYIVHPVHVSLVLIRHGFGENRRSSVHRRRTSSIGGSAIVVNWLADVEQ